MLMVHTLLTAALIAAAGTPASPSQAPPSDLRAPLRLQVVAVDRDGAPVTDLRPDEFEVWVNIYRVPIQTVTVVSPASERGRAIVLLLDDIIVTPALALRVKEVARYLVNRMGPDDQMAVVPLKGGPAESTGERAHLLRSIDAYNGMSGGVIPFDALGQHVLETIASVSRQFSEVSGTKFFVGIGAGWLFDLPIQPGPLGRDLRKEWVDAIRAMASADAKLYVIDPGGVGTAPSTSGSSGFARETGGHSFSNTNDWKGAADRIMQETSNYYVLDVADPPIGRKADLRELDVRVLRRGVTVRARRWIPGVR